MATTVVQLPGLLSSRPFFLSVWVLTYVLPHTATAMIDLALVIPLAGASPGAWDVETWLVWVGLLPALYAWAQWLLIRRCLSSPIPWVAATYVGTLLARAGVMLIPEPSTRMALVDPAYRDVIFALVPLVGVSAAVTIAMALPAGLVFGFATAIPQAIVIPGSRRARFAWLAVMIPTELISTVMGMGLYEALQRELALQPFSSGFLLGVIALNFGPRLCSWLLVAIVGGLLMYAILRRNLGALGEQVYGRFD